jgi:enoyl-CoA hydratase/carnithine racemase
VPVVAKAEFRQDGLVGEIVLADKPLNLFSLELARDLIGAVDELAGSGARAALVHAEGDNFSAGASVEIFLDRDQASARELIEELLPGIRRFESLSIPTVAAVRGLCLAAGLEVALSCDMIWAAQDAQLGLVEGVIGATPFGGGTQRLVARAGAGRAAEAVLTARTYPADTMLEWGVVNRVVAGDELLPKARALAARLAAGPTLAHAATKRMIRTAVDEGVEAADEALPEAGARVIASDDLQRGVRTLKEKGPGHAEFEGR